MGVASLKLKEGEGAKFLKLKYSAVFNDGKKLEVLYQRIFSRTTLTPTIF